MKNLQEKITSCTLCEDQFPHEARPIVQFSRQSKILIAGQAPGAKVHKSGLPFDDASGDRLREWMGINRHDFYDRNLVAIVPMAFCYPGKGKSGDLPPPKLCAETWRDSVLVELQQLKLTLVVGQYAQAWHLLSKSTLTQTVKAWRSYSQNVLPLPHPSPRNNIWLSKNPWFELELVAELRKRVKLALS